MFTTEQLRLSPVHERLQLTVVRSEPGVAVLSMPLTDDIKGVYEGTVHGGMLATFADAACASCLWGTYDFGPPVHSHDRHPRALLPSAERWPLIAEAKMVHKGRRLLSAECVVVDAADRILIRSTATFMLVEAGR